MRRPTLALTLLALTLPAALPSARAAPADPAPSAEPRAACDVKGARIEEAIAAKGELRKGANVQTLRDLRTLRDAAIVLDTYKYPGECEVLLGIARTLLADPDRTIEQAGDTDEDKAESVAEARKPKAPTETKAN